MESTKDNIVRVESLIAEIEPHVKHLKRQAEKATQEKEVADKLRQEQERLFAFVWHQFDTERRQLASERDALTKKVAVLEEECEAISRLLSQEAAKAEDQAMFETGERLIRDARIQLNGLEREQALLDGRIQLETERRIPRESTTSALVDLTYVQSKLFGLRKNQETLIEQLEQVTELSALHDISALARTVHTDMVQLHEDAAKGSVITKRTITLSDEERAESDQRLKDYRERQDRVKEACAALQKTIEDQESVLAGERAKNQASRDAFFQAERNLRIKQHELNTAKDTLNESKIRLARVEVREEDLKAQVKEELATEPSTLTYNGQPIDRTAVERTIARLKVQLEYIGGIDPLVVEEYREMEQRYTFLLQESTDLKNALDALQQIVQEMDGKIRKEFETAWKHISLSFTQYFELIFGGGKAELAKVRITPQTNGSLDETGDTLDDDHEHTFETGIEIFACPPGKKIHNLSMLSGGERSLTSLALLFAIISHNPPPFAVLDEVEAALDEANSRRLSRVFRELSHKTQFVAITHNRETMRQASILYGVTMGDDGVSKLLSVRFDQMDTTETIK